MNTTCLHRDTDLPCTRDPGHGNPHWHENAAGEIDHTWPINKENKC